MTPIMVHHASRRRAAFVDLALLVWIGGWVVAGVLVGFDVHRLGRLATAFADSGRALGQTSTALHALSGLPLVGHALSRVASDIHRSAASATANASMSRADIYQLSYLLAVAVAVLPVVPVLAVYLPSRIGRAREVKALRRILSDQEQESVERYLAQRALYTLAYHQLAAIGERPWGYLESPDYHRLADAELARLGFSRPEHAARV